MVNHARPADLTRLHGRVVESAGVFTDGRTVYVNASTCDLRYRVAHRPVVLDVPLPGHDDTD
jgi:hypothetical protein